MFRSGVLDNLVPDFGILEESVEHFFFVVDLGLVVVEKKEMEFFVACKGALFINCVL